MNTADYLSTTDYPVTTQGLDFIQNQILCLEQMAAAFGDGNWILSGMTEDAEGNLTPGVVALVENSKATVVNFTQGGVSASGLKNKHFRIDTTTNALPKRSYQFLIEDPDGEITALDRIDIHELAEQIKDNAAAIKVCHIEVDAVDKKITGLNTAIYGEESVVNGVHFQKRGDLVFVNGYFSEKLQGIPRKYCPSEEQVFVILVGTSGDYGAVDIAIYNNGIMQAYWPDKRDSSYHVHAVFQLL